MLACTIYGNQLIFQLYTTFGEVQGLQLFEKHSDFVFFLNMLPRFSFFSLRSLIYLNKNAILVTTVPLHMYIIFSNDLGLVYTD